jgi:CPA1 family monovalent cation:H+ antiporter
LIGAEPDIPAPCYVRRSELNDEIEFQLIEAERLAINDRYRRGQLKDEARRRVERELDLRDARLTNLRAEE